MKKYRFDKKFYPYEHEEYIVRKPWELGVVFLILVILSIIILLF